MIKKIRIFYDLKEKTNGQRSRIIQKLYGYRDKSNYKYSYERPGLLKEIEYKKDIKTVLTLKNENDLAKISEILKSLKIDFDIAKSK